MPTKTWIATTAANWNSAANWSPSGIPATGDDVIFNGAANGNCTIVTTAGACRSLVMTGYTGTLTLTVGINISGSDDGTVTGNTLVLGSGTVYTGTGVITLTSTTGGKVTCNGNTLSCSLTVNGVGGTFTLTDALNIVSTRALILRAGTVTGTTVNAGFFESNATTSVRSISLTTMTLNGSGTLSSLNVFTAAATNYTNTITNLYLTGTGAGDKYLVMGGSGVTNIYFACTGTGTDNVGFSTNAGACVNCYFTGTNSGLLLVSRSPEATGNLDFGTSSLSWNSSASAITWNIGGNIIFSPNMTVNTTQNPIVLTAASGTSNITMNGKTFTSGFTCNNAAGTFNFLDAAAFSGTLTLTAGTYNVGTITGVTTLNITAGTYNQTGNVTCTGTMTFTAGTMNVTGNVTTSIFNSNNSNTRTINMGAGTWTITGTGTAWNLTTSANATLNAQQSRILINNTASPAATISFQGGGLTYYTVEHARGSATATCTFNGSNTYANFIDNASTAAHTLSFASGTTHTFYKFNVRGSAGALITISRSSTTLVTLTKVGQGIVPYCDYITIGTVTATPSSTWYVGANGSIGTGTGWVAGAAPSSQSLLGAGGVG
jgi:hypothetical protein